VQHVQGWPTRRIGVVAFLSAALLAAGYTSAGGFAFDVRITEDGMHQMVAAKLPLEHVIGPIVWRVNTADLTVLDQGRVGFDSNLHGAVSDHEADAHVAGSGVLAYRSGAFWLSDFHIDRLDHVVVHNAESSERPSGPITKAWREVVGHNEHLKAAIGEVRDEVMTEALKHAGDIFSAIFARIPVYRLHDDLKGSVTRLVLVSVGTDGHDLIAHVDPLGGVLRAIAKAVVAAILLYAFLCLLAARTRAFIGIVNWALFWW
jgi:hypothetical protein